MALKRDVTRSEENSFCTQTHTLQVISREPGQGIMQLLAKVFQVLQVNLQVEAPLLGTIHQAVPVHMQGPNAKVPDEFPGVVRHTGGRQLVLLIPHTHIQTLWHSKHTVTTIPVHPCAGFIVFSWKGQIWQLGFLGNPSLYSFASTPLQMEEPEIDEVIPTQDGQEQRMLNEGMVRYSPG
jgi:hypothetical protein